MGFIAQEIESLVGTKYNIRDIAGDKAGTYSLRYNDFITPRVKAIQEQQALIAAQKKEISLEKEKTKSL